MAEDLAGNGDAGGEEHRRPDDGVETGDVLAHEVEVRRPPFVPTGFVVAVTGGREIVDERVEPDIDDAPVVEGNRNAPVEAGSAHGEVEEARFEDIPQFVAAGFRFDETGVVAVEVEQPVAVRRESEEVVALADPVRFVVMDGAASLREVFLLFEGFAGNAVPALVGAFVEIAGVADGDEEFLDRGAVALLGGADELVEGDVQLRPDAAEDFLHPFAVVERVEPLLGGLPAHIQRVLVGAHEEVGVVSGGAPEAGDHIGGDLLVGGSEVGRRVDIVDRRGEVVAGHGPGL